MGFVCTVQGCDNPRDARGLCKKHWKRWRRHGSPVKGRSPNGQLEAYYNDVVLPYEGDECLTWPFYCDPNGYAKMRHNGRPIVVSRRLCEEVNGPPPRADYEAAHSCGRGQFGCVNRSHLSWKTRAENCEDKICHGTHVFGEGHPSAKLTWAEVQKIRALKGRLTEREMASRFDVSQGCVGHILRGTTWKLWTELHS